MCHDFVCDGCLDLTNNRDVAPARLLINISLFLGTPIIVIIIVKKTDVSFKEKSPRWFTPFLLAAIRINFRGLFQPGLITACLVGL